MAWVAVSLAVGLAVPPLAAQTTFYWDINGSTAGASGSTTAAGTWSATDANWSTSSAGTAATAAWLGGVDSAVFSAGTNATGAYTVAVDGTQSLGGLTVEEGTLTFSGGTLQIAAPSVLNIAGTTTVASTLLDDNGFGVTKTGAGRLILSGTNELAGPVQISAGTLTLDGSGVLNDSGDAVLVDSGATLELRNGTALTQRTMVLSGGTLSGDASTNVFGGVITLAGANTLSVQSGGVLDVNQMIDTGGFTKLGGGTLLLDTASSFSGAATLSAGLTIVSQGFALGSTAGGTTLAAGATLELQQVTIANEAFVFDGGTLGASGGNSIISGTGGLAINGPLIMTVASGNNLTITALLSGSGDFAKQGAGALYLGGSNTGYSGKAVVEAGNLVVQSGNALGTVGADHGTAVSSGATLTLGASALSLSETVTLNGGTLAATVGSSTLAEALVFGADSFVSVTGTQLSINARISGAYGFTKQGAGTLVLGNSENSYTGPLTISAGTVRLGTSNVLADAGAVQIGTGATLAANFVTVTETLGTLSGSGTLALGASTVTVNAAAASNATFSGTLTGTTGTLRKSGAADSLLTLSGNNSAFTGSIAVDAGTLRVTQANGLGDTTGGTTVAAGATLDLPGVAIGAEAMALNGGTLSNSSTTADSSLSGGVTLGTGTSSTLSVADAGRTLTLAGVIGGSGNLEKTGAGVAILGGSSTYSGTTTVTAGTLRVTQENGLGDTTGGTTVAAGATLDLQGVLVGAEAVALNGGALSNSSVTANSRLSGAVTLGAGTSSTILMNASGGTFLTLSGVIGGAGNLEKTGSGLVVLSGANAYTGTTTVSDGTLRVTHSSGLGTADAGTTVATGAILEVAGVAIGNETLTLTGGTLYGNSATASEWAGPLILGGGSDSTVGSASTLTLSGEISGAGSLTAGAAEVVLTRSNTYTGTTTINGGSTLTVATGASLGSTAGGTILQDDSTLALAGVSLGDEAVQVVASATIRASNGSSAMSGDVAVGTSLMAEVADGSTLAISGVITGESVEKYGQGTLTLSRANSITGVVGVWGGQLRLEHSQAIGSTGTVGLINATMTLGSDSALSVAPVLSTNSLADAIISDRATAGAGVTHRLAAIYIGQGTGLTLRPGDAVTSGVAGLSVGTIAFGTLANLSVETGAALTIDRLNDFDVFSVLNLAVDGQMTVLEMVGSNSFTLNKTGTGTLTATLAGLVSGAHTIAISEGTFISANSSSGGYRGAGTTVAGGAVFETQNALGAENVTLNGGTLRSSTISVGSTGTVTLGADSVIETLTDLTLSGTLTDGGNGYGLTKRGSATLTLAGTANYAGATAIEAGTLRLGSNASRLSNSATVSISAGATFAVNSVSDTVGAVTGSGAVTLGSGVLTLANATGTYDGIISGSGGVTLSGGDMTLSGANVYTGTTTVSGGTLRLGADGVLWDSGAVVVSGGTFDLNGRTETIGTLTVNSGTFRTGVNGRLVGTGATITFAGGTNTIEAGAVVEDQHIVITGGTNTVEAGGTLKLSTPSGGPSGLELTGSTLTLNADATLAGGKLLLQGDVTTFASGTTAQLADSGTGANRGTIDLDGGTRIFTVADGAAATDLAISAVIANGSLTKAGAGLLELSGANTSTGTTTISAGTLQLGAANVIADSSAVAIDAGASLRLNGFSEAIGTLSGAGSIQLGSGSLTTTNAAATSFSGAISGTGGVTKAGSGALTLSGANTYTGTTTISAGTLELGAANVIADASAVVVEAGAVLQSTFTETLASLNGGGTLELSGGTLTLAGNSTFGTLHVTGNSVLNFSGTLAVTNFIVDAGVQFTVSNEFYAANWWTDATMTTRVDKNVSGTTPYNQVTITAYADLTPEGTGWSSYNDYVTPVPEPSTYGALVLGGVLAAGVWRRRHRAAKASAANGRKRTAPGAHA